MACENSSGPSSAFVGAYALVSIDGDTLRATQIPDGGQRYVLGYMRTESAGHFGYTLLAQTCYGNGCTSPELFESEGTWIGNGRDFTLKNSSGASEEWHFSKYTMSGVTTNAFKPGARLVFQRCDDSKPDGCYGNILK